MLVDKTIRRPRRSPDKCSHRESWREHICDSSSKSGGTWYWCYKCGSMGRLCDDYETIEWHAPGKRIEE